MARSSRPRPLRLVALGASAVAIASLARSINRRRRGVAMVDPELRSPVLYLPTDMSERRITLGRALMRWGPPPVPGVNVTPRLVGPGDTPPSAFTYERPDRVGPSGALVWIHGGGMVLGTAASDHRWCSSLADELGILVVNVEYRLAPEHPFPAALDDCMAALEWLHDNADELGVDRDRIAVGGGSAGGGLAAAVSQRARDADGPAVCFSLLNYPMIDDRTVLTHDQHAPQPFVWTANSNRVGWTAYLGAPPALHDDRPYAAPARTQDLAGLPPTWIGVGSLDLFLAEDLDYAARLAEANVAVELRQVPGMYHGADQVKPKAKAMIEYRAAMVDALRRALA